MDRARDITIIVYLCFSGCARHSADVDDLLGEDAPRPHCLPNGNFDSLQCIDDRCFCANATQVTGDITNLETITDLICCKSLDN